MDKFLITAGTPLQGTVTVSGAKNAALPLLAASILTDQRMTLHNLPHVADIQTMRRLLTYLGTTWDDGSTMHIHAATIERPEAPYDIVKTMRASSLILGPLLARCGRASVSLPGGCAIGARPLDLHLKALSNMGATIAIENGNIVATASRLRGIDHTFDKVTVTGTENVMMAATLARGTTLLRNAAREPEVTHLADCLCQMGAHITGAGSETITIDGVERLNGIEWTICADRIEAGTFLIAGAMTQGDITIHGMVPAHVEALIDTLRSAGAEISETAHGVRVTARQPLRGVDCTTAPFPGFATDLQAQWMAAMATASSPSLITETIFENRFMHVAELRRLGADITVEGHAALVKPVACLRGAPVMATDLRASASLVLAALCAEGTTELQRVYHIDRGYENIVGKLQSLGAKIERVTGQSA